MNDGLSAQSRSNIRYTNFSLQGDTLLLDSLSIVRGTVAVRDANGNLVDSADYQIRAFESKLIWRNKPEGDSVKIFFRVYPFSLTNATYRKDYAAYKKYSAESVARPFSVVVEDPKSKLIDFGSL